MTRILDWLQRRWWVTVLVLLLIGLVQAMTFVLTFRMAFGQAGSDADMSELPAGFSTFMYVMPFVSAVPGVFMTALVVGLITAAVAQYGMTKDGIFRGVSSTVFSFGAVGLLWLASRIMDLLLFPNRIMFLAAIVGMLSFFIGVGVQIVVVALDVKGRRLREYGSVPGTSWHQPARE